MTIQDPHPQGEFVRITGSRTVARLLTLQEELKSQPVTVASKAALLLIDAMLGLEKQENHGRKVKQAIDISMDEVVASPPTKGQVEAWRIIHNTI